MKSLITTIFMFITLQAMAQGITGKIVDEKQRPIPFVNIAVLSAIDSTLLDGTTSNVDGTFLIEDVRQGSLLRVSSIGYKTEFMVYNGKPFITIALYEDSHLLGEVIVKSKLPKTVLRGEGMTTTVVGSILEKTSSMEHLLDLIPNVSARNGEIVVLGRGNPVIYINGRKMRDAMELERLQPDEIKNVEVITNPGARYDANVRSVIRITTKKPVGEGFSFDTKTNSTVNEQKRMSWVESLRLNYRKGKLDMNAQLYGAYTHRQDDKQIRQITYLNDTWEQTTAISQEYTNINPYLRLATSYTLNADNSIGASISYDRYAKNLGVGDSKGMAMRNEQQTELSSSHVESPATSKALSTNVYYTGTIGKLGVDFNTDYYWSGKKETMDNIEQYKEIGKADLIQKVNSNRRTYNCLFASKLVLSTPFFSGNFSFGGEFSTSKRKSFYTVLPQGVVNDENSRIKENMTSVFVDYSRAFGKLNVQAGLRYEYIDFNYYDHGKYIPEQSKKYGNIFPSLALSMPVGKTQMQLTYAADIYRPSYYELRDGVQYDNRYTYDSGNPFLVPSISRNISYALSWKWLNFSAMYARISNEVCTLVQTYKDNPQTTLARPENMPSYSNMQASLALSPKFGIWSPALEMMVFKQWFYMDTHERKNLNCPVASFQLTNTFDMKWMTASVIVAAQTEGNMGNKFVRKGYFNTDVSLYKSLLHDRLTLQLYVSDLFGTADQYHIFYSGPQRSTYYDSYSSSSVTFTIRYRFNATNSKYKGTSAGRAQRSRM
ncbi:TonB-linked outer membrane protein, SusC/RagA family [Porphyromonas macacae]|uniref:TonB-linked outer membrane protein, SusC/RagA family n=1 Tax=Porphyromonas macacae TaxID=28115 RepID=A0A379E7P2_9PORP|nr:outer membrane beta-barrel family protein [Porphyromonas macacae]SUB88715.1 TonB-linked outer membrane protein, SusC/RagA family [Porphyromonas macacae]